VNYLRQVQIGIDYIESMLDSDITADDIARQAGVSQWHFQRIFKALTNETLQAYVRSRRLSNSLDMLLKSDLRIVDIALSAGYENQESYTRAFRQSFDITPSAYRRIGRRAAFLKKIEIDKDYIRHIQSNVNLEPIIKKYPERVLVGLRTQFYSVDSEKNNIAQQLPQLWDRFLKRLSEVSNTIDGTCYGAVYRVAAENEQLNYLASIEVSKDVSIPEEMEQIRLPEASYAQFKHYGEATDLNNTVNYIYGNWLLNSGYKHTYGPDLEFYGAHYLPASSDSIVEYAIPIERID